MHLTRARHPCFPHLRPVDDDAADTKSSSTWPPSAGPTAPAGSTGASTCQLAAAHPIPCRTITPIRTRPTHRRADDSSDDNADDNPAPAAPFDSRLSRRSTARASSYALLGVAGSNPVVWTVVTAVHLPQFTRAGLGVVYLPAGDRPLSCACWLGSGRKEKIECPSCGWAETSAVAAQRP